MAHIYEPRVRETSLSEGTGNIALEGAMRGSLAFAEVMEEDDTADIVISYDNVFTEVTVTMNGDGELVRGTCWRTRHDDGTIDTEHLNLPPGVKTLIMTIAAGSVATQRNSIRFDIAQSLSDVQKALFVANLGRWPAESGTRALLQQASAPLGWTKETNWNDYALRLVNGSPTVGGSLAFSTVFGRTATDAHTLTSAQSPIITPVFVGAAATITPTHPQGNIVSSGFTGQIESFGAVRLMGDLGNVSVVYTPSGTINAIGGGQSHQHGIDMRLRYVDIIIAQKD